MSEPVKTALVEYTDKLEPAEIRGYENADYSREGIVSFSWSEPEARLMVIPLHRVASIRHYHEQEAET